MSSLFRLKALLAPHAGRVGAAFALSILASSGLLAVPVVVKHLFATALAQRDFVVSPAAGLGLLAAGLAMAAAGYATSCLMFTTAHLVAAELRRQCAMRLLRAPLAVHRDQSAGEMLDRLIESLTQIEMFLKSAVAFGLSLILVFGGGTVMLFVLSWPLALVMMLTLPLIWLGLRALLQRARQLSKVGNQNADRVAARLHEMLLGIEMIKAFHAESHELNRLQRHQDELLGVRIKSARFSALIEPLMIFVFLGALLAMAFFGSQLLAAGQMRPEELVAFLLYTLMLIPQTRGLSQIYIGYQHLDRSFQRLDEILDLPEEIDPVHPVAFPARPRGEISLTRVVHAYPGRERALNSLSLHIDARECVGIVGSSGAGKTTLFNLLLRFYAPQSGVIRIDGFDIQQVRSGDLRRAIALVPQDIMLFDDTLLENVRYGRPGASDEEVRAACRAARAHDFIMSLPEQYQTIAGGRGLKLSGGQRQRLAIARALLKDAPILLLDEATSSLDSRTELELREAMDTVRQGRTTLVIAHRLATVVHLPRLIVLDRGQVLDEGTHDELMLHCEAYRQLISSQLIPQEQDMTSPFGLAQA